MVQAISQRHFDQEIFKKSENFSQNSLGFRTKKIDGCKILWEFRPERLKNSEINTPGPWLVRFFRSGKNPHEPNPHHLSH